MSKQSSATQARRVDQSGFTLVEVLVVLIITGIVVGVLFQALEHAYRLQQRFGTELFKVQQGQMAADWYRQTIQGLYPDFPDGHSVFHGDEQEFSGLTGNPLSDDYGAPTRITWKLKTQNDLTELIYSAENRETTILAWRSNQAHFIYIDAQQAPHDHWPPPLGVAEQLPRQIQLITQDAGDPINIIASTRGPVSPRLRYGPTL